MVTDCWAAPAAMSPGRAPARLASTVDLAHSCPACLGVLRGGQGVGPQLRARTIRMRGRTRRPGRVQFVRAGPGQRQQDLSGPVQVTTLFQQVGQLRCGVPARGVGLGLQIVQFALRSQQLS